MPVFRSRAQAAVLTEVLLRPETEVSVTDLAARLGMPLSTVHDEVRRLLGAAILSERAVGRSRLVRANSDNPAVRPLTELVTMTLGVPTIVRDAFSAIREVERVYLYGSWAACYLGEVGPVPHDLDVLVVGSPTRADVYEAADTVERLVGFPVNPVVVRPERWAAKKADALVRTIRSGPTVAVYG